MKTHLSLPGSQWFSWVQNRALRIGVVTGVYLSTVMIVALLAANRVPFLENFADIRNTVFRVLFGLVALIPVVFFARSAGHMFTAGVSGWFLFSLAYMGMGFFFHRLHMVFPKPLNVFMLGACIYGVLAVALWVASMVMVARHHPVAASRRRP